MRNALAIYKWGVNVSEYEWLMWVDEHHGKFDEPFARSAPFGANWWPRTLLRCKDRSTADKPLSDTPQTQPCVRVLSRRGLDTLRDLLEPSCEILPLESALGEFWAVNCIVEARCVDLAASNFRADDHARVAQMYAWAFDPARLPAAHVFRTPESCTTFLVSQTFVDRAREARLLGFRFDLLWTPEGGAIEQSRDFTVSRGAYLAKTEPWERKEILRLKAEMRRKRKEAQT